MTSAKKVSELFTTAGEAFCKLSEIARVLQTSSEKSTKNDGGSDFLNNADSSCWTIKDTELLHAAVKRFGDDINVISEHIKDKTMCQIKSTFKKISTASGKSEDSLSNVANSVSSGNKLGSGFQEVNNLSTTINSSASITSHRSLSTNVSTSETSNNKNTSKTTSSVAGGESSSISGPANSSTPSTSSATSSICPSPSPFLHYPLLRKSADITLNMLNARDDSDDEDRMTTLSVFNST